MHSKTKLVLATAIFLNAVITASAGNADASGRCAAHIAQLEQQIRAGRPIAPQSIEAQLHRQPTAATVQRAESNAIADANAALQYARRADPLCEVSDVTPLDRAL